MTQSPPPPQMPPEPLDESERLLARALRNLPVGAPPPELDARILGAARRAVHLAPPRKNKQRRWLIGFGTAASALLAIGLFVKTHAPSEGAVFTPPAETRTSESANAPAATAAMKEQPESHAAADAMAPAGNTATAQSSVPAEAASPKKSERAQKAFGSLSAAKYAPQAFPAIAEPPPPPPRMQAPAPPVVLEEPAPMAAPSPPASPPAPPPMQAVAERQERKVEQDVAARRDAAAAIAAPASPATARGATLDQPALGKTTSNALKSSAAMSGQAASGSAHAADARKDESLDRVEVPDSGIKRANDSRTGPDERLTRAVLPSVDDDAKLAPAQWIERIRARVKAADGDGARESLRRYRLRYPNANIPDDLQLLLQ